MEIPVSVISIGGGAFSNCSSFTSVTMPDSVTNIGDLAFSFCESLVSVAMSNSVTSIEANAFFGCISIRKYHIKASMHIRNKIMGAV